MHQETLDSHAQRVLSVAQHKSHLGRQNCEKQPEIRITRSWERCLENYGLDPNSRTAPFIVERAELADCQDRVHELLGDVIQTEMEQLYQRIVGSGYSLILTNSDGVILNYVGDPALSDYFQQAGLHPGAVWSEYQQGTNGIGTCLHEQVPLTIHRDEHFLSRNIHLTCSASPIFDAQGQLLAILDVSSVSSQDSKAVHAHTAALINMSAKLMENFGFLRQSQHYWILRFHTKYEYVGHFSEGILALDESGRVVYANQCAVTYLGFNDRKAIVGQHIGNIFTTNLALIVGLANRQPNSVFTLHAIQDNKPFYCLLKIPQRLPTTPAPRKQRIHIGREPWCLSLEGLAGKDKQMACNVQMAHKVVNKSIPILLFGETGTGKEAFAKSIHQASNRAEKPFVALNCAAIPESLIESELFGYKHGAFTGARREGMRGKILQSNHGTLFLDEIGDMPLSLQTRLLRVLEEKEVLPLGSETPVQVNLNVISATHHDLAKLIEQGEFRQDLYYRLNGIQLKLPALRERTDLEHIIHCALAAENTEHVQIEIEAEAFELLVQYHYPGNIRQLRNVLRTALALREGNVITVNDLPSELTHAPLAELATLSPINLDSGFADAMPAAPSLAVQTQKETDVLACAERNVILQALEQHRWNITNTATSLNMSRNTLYRKMKKHCIDLPSHSR